MKAFKRFLFFLVLLPLIALTLWLAVQAVTAARGGHTDDALGWAVGAFFVGCIPATMLLTARLLGWAEREAGDIRRRRADHPEEPWLWREEWAERRIEHLESRAGLAIVWGFALLWNLVTLGSGALVQRQSGLANEPGVVIFLVVFLAVGLLLLTLAIKGTVRRAKYGRSVLELETLPGVLGGELRGVIRSPANLAPDAEVRLALDCVRVIHRAGGGGSSTSNHLEWRIDKTIVAAASGGAIPVSLEVPYDCPETTPEDPDAPARTHIRWSLKASASTPGVDYFARFEVPVFKTADSDSGKLKLAIGADDAAAAEPPLTRIAIVPLASGGTAIRYPRPGWLVPWLVASAVPPAVAGLMVWLSHRHGLELLTTLGIGGAVSLAILGIALLGLVTQPRQVEILPAGLHVRRGVRYLGWTRRIPRGDISGIAFDGYQNGTKMSYSVDAKLAGESSRNLAVGVRTVEEARWLAAQLQLYLGLPRGTS